MSDEVLPSDDKTAHSTDANEASSDLATLKALVAEAKGYKANFDSQVLEAVNSVGNLATTAKSHLSDIDASKTTIATIKGAVEEMQRSASSDASTIAQSKLDIDKLKSEGEILSTKVSDEYGDITKEIALLQEQHAALKTILGDLDTIKSVAKKNSDDVTHDVNAIAESKTTFETLAAQSQATHDELERKQTAVGAQLSEIANSNETIKQFHAALLDDTPDKKSIRSEIDDLQTRIGEVLSNAEKHHGTAAAEFSVFKEKTAVDVNDFVTSERSRFDDLYTKLQGQILSLLPSAGSAGLASTYYDAKSKYAFTAFHRPFEADGNIKQTPTIRKFFGHDPTSLIATLFFYGLFLGPVAVIIWLFSDILAKMAGPHPVAFSNQYLVFKALIALPLGTMSIFGYSSLRLYRRLYEEYNYKQRVMELYQSFSKEIETKGDDDQKKALLAIMLKAVADKPSLNMHKYDGIGDGGWKIDIGALLSRFVGGTKP